MNKPKNIDEYISAFPAEVQNKLQEMRRIIRRAAPEAIEVISYAMPAFKMGSVLVYFAANKNHIGFYPTASPIIFFREKLSSYKTSKGAIQLPLGEPLPEDLIMEIVLFRLKEVKNKK